MRTIVAFFKNPLVASLLGLAAIALIIWFVGPLIAIAGYEPLVSPLARLILILVVVVLWGANQLRKRLTEQRANAQIAAGLTQPDPAEAKAAPGSPQGEDEVARLRQRFTEALGVLKKSRGKSGGPALSALPWYVIIGPPGAGKTTALQNSGLRFPLEDRFGKEGLRGVGGTRNCDWWFSDDAILVDTAGRYFTQDSDPHADSAAWGGFLALLKKHRRRRPLNGVFVALSLSDLLLQNQSARLEHIRVVKKRIGELYEHFGIRFPIYVLLTKADLIAGFTDFFEDLGKEERAQVWGFTRPLEEKGGDRELSGQLVTEFDAHLHRLRDRLLTRMEQERDPARRALIFGFPRQVALLRDVLDEFLTGCFRPSQYEAPLLLRGVYFTSGTQEGTPIDRLLGSVARGFGLGAQAVAPARGPGRSYFITDVLRRVVFAEANLAGTNRRLEQLRAWGQRGAYVGAVAAVLLAGLAWLVSYRNNRAYVDAVEQQAAAVEKDVAALTPQNLDLGATLPALDGARAIPGGYADRDASIPWSARFGLYQGKKLGRAAEETYHRLLQDVLLPRTLLRVEGQVRNGPNDPDFLLEGLRVYRMLGEGTHVEPETIQAWAALDWETNPGNLANDDRRRLEEHLKALLDKPPAAARVALDGALIRQTQRTLRAAPLAERAYARLKRRPAEGVRPFTIAEAAGKDAPIVFARRSGEPLTEGVPGLYTRAGYESVFLGRSRELSQQIAEEDWVLKDEAEAKDAAARPASAELEEGVLKLYLEDYGRQYENLLGDLTIVPIRNMDQAVYVLQILSSDQSPLLALLQAVARETALGPKADDKKPDENDKAGGALDAAKTRLREIMGAAASNTAAQVTRGNQSIVEAFAKERFGELHEQMLAKEGAKPPFQGVLDTLNELYVFMDSIRKNPNAAKALMDGSRQLDAIVGNLERQVERQPKVVKGLLGEVGSASKSIGSGDVRQHLNALWRSEGLSFCRQAIADRYPIARDSRTDITLQDFGGFFGPGGVMDVFFEKNLGELVDTSRSPWTWRPGSAMANASPGALIQFDRARRIKETFFPGGGKVPSVSFELTPLTMDPSITQFVLDIEGRRVTYDHGPAIPAVVAWPGQGPRQVRIELSPPGGNGPSGTMESGPWGWFRLLDRSRLEPSGTREQFNVTFSVGGRNARFRLAATSAFNPFGSDMLRAFRCPDSL